MGVSGVEAFLISIQRQAEVSSSGAKPTGLMRFSLSVSNAFLIFSLMIIKNPSDVAIFLSSKVQESKYYLNFHISTRI